VLVEALLNDAGCSAVVMFSMEEERRKKSRNRKTWEQFICEKSGPPQIAVDGDVGIADMVWSRTWCRRGCVVEDMVLSRDLLSSSACSGCGRAVVVQGCHYRHGVGVGVVVVGGLVVTRSLHRRGVCGDEGGVEVKGPLSC
jgi:hypothetical protein